MTKPQVIELLENGVSSTRIEELVRVYGISFEVTPQAVTEFRDAGASEDLVKALREISPKPESPPPSAKPEGAAPTSPTTNAPTAPAAAILTLETTPAGAEVYVDEERIGKTGPEGKLKISTLGPGEHRIRVSAAGYEDFSRAVELTAGQTTVLAVTLVAVKPLVTETPASSQAGAQTPAKTGITPAGDNPMDVYKSIMAGLSEQEQGDPNIKRFYVTHDHGKGVLGYGGGMCSGWLLIGQGRVQFSSTDEDDAFEIAASEISELQIKSNHIRFRAKNKKYHLMTQDMGFFGGESQGPGTLRKAFEAVGLKVQSK